MPDPDFRIEFGSDGLLPAFCAGFNAGFVDYKYGVQMDEAQMVKFLARSGIDLKQSAVLLQRNDDGWRGAGVALIALEDGAAWCSGLAVAPTLRGSGFGRRLMEAIQVRAAAAGARTLWLETLVHNTPAQRLYASLGYQPRRDLLFWRTDARAGQAHDASDLHAANVQEALVAAYAWQHQPPAWQRSQRAVARYQDELWAYKLQDAGETAGWVICLPTAPHHPGQTRLRIMTLAVRPGEQQTTLAHRLLASLRAHQPDTVLTVINEPETSLFTAALQDTGFVEMDRQIEMVLALQ